MGKEGKGIVLILAAPSRGCAWLMINEVGESQRLAFAEVLGAGLGRDGC